MLWLSVIAGGSFLILCILPKKAQKKIDKFFDKILK
jgi:hypothetical protein